MPLTRDQAQQRADDIQAFYREVERLHVEQALSLGSDQLHNLELHHQQLLGDYRAQFDIDHNLQSKRLSLSMRITSLLGALALAASLLFEFDSEQLTRSQLAHLFRIGQKLSQVGIDGLRVDAVASMLYRDYSRKAGEWVPNRHGGRENLEAIEFLRRTNHLVGTQRPEAVMLAEESTAFPAVTRPPSDDLQGGGLGFHYKWNMGWMNDVLAYMARDPIHRQHHHDQIRFSLMYAFSENFVLPFSHDEVVHGKGSLLGKMPGDDWQKFANLRLMYGFMWGHPGKKLLFMGCEFAPRDEWNADRALPWELLEHAPHAGVQRLVRDLNRVLRACPALHELDASPEGFGWIDHADAAHSILVFERRATSGERVLVLCNFTPVVRHGWRIGVPQAGSWAELINTDADVYGGSNVVNGPLASELVPWQGQAQSVQLTLPPLATVMLVRRG